MSEDYNFVNVKNEPNRTSDVWNAKIVQVSGKHEISGILEGRAQVRSGLTFWTWGYLGAGPRRVLKG